MLLGMSGVKVAHYQGSLQAVIKPHVCLQETWLQEDVSKQVCCAANKCGAFWRACAWLSSVRLSCVKHQYNAAHDNASIICQCFVIGHRLQKMGKVSHAKASEWVHHVHGALFLDASQSLLGC